MRSHNSYFFFKNKSREIEISRGVGSTCALYRCGRPPPGRAPQPLPAARPQVQRVVRWALYAYICSIPFEMPGRSIPVEIPTLVGSVFLLATLLDRRAAYRRFPAPLTAFAAYLWVFVLAA